MLILKKLNTLIPKIQQANIYLKFLTAIIFISCLVLSAFKAYEDSYLSSLNLLLISLFSAFINDRILLQPETENLEEDD